MSDPRIEAAARSLYEAETGNAWDELPSGVLRDSCLLRAAAIVEAVDAADDRIRLTLPEFNAIKAEALTEVHDGLWEEFQGAQMRAIECAYVPEYILERRDALGSRYIEPVNVHEAMASLIRERVGAELADLADSLDAGSLEEITRGIDLNPNVVTARFQRRMIQGCAEWMRERAADLKTGSRRLYARVDTALMVDEDRLTALKESIAGEVARSERLAEISKRTTAAFIMTDRIRAAVNAVEPGTFPEPEETDA